MSDTAEDDVNVLGQMEPANNNAAPEAPAPVAPVDKKQALPTFDEALSTQKDQKPTFDEALQNGADQPRELTDTQRGVLSKLPGWQTVKDFGQGYAEDYKKNIFLEPETQEAFNKYIDPKKYGDGEASINNAFMDALFTPAVRSITGEIAREVTAAANVVQETYLNAPIAGIRSAGFEKTADFLSTLTDPQTLAAVPIDVFAPLGAFRKEAVFKNAKANGVLEDEAVFRGAAPTEEQAKSMQEATQHLPPEPPPAPTIHEVARQVDPEVFTHYDALKARQEVLRNWYDKFREERNTAAEAQSTYVDDLAEAKDKLENGSPKNRKVYQARVDDLTDKHEAWVAENKTVESESMKNTREKLQDIDYQLQDIAKTGRLSAAYKEAEARMPPAAEAKEEVAPTTPAPSPAAPEGPKIGENTTLSLKPIEDQKADIAAKVSQNLVAAGRPKEEADAAARLVAEHYQARSERFGGKNGTAEEMYARDSATIRAGKTVSKARELAQAEPEGKTLLQKAQGKIRLATDKAKAVITLFKTANASTFIHETGHAWLEEILKDSEHELATQSMKDDANIVRKWLGNDGGEITTKQHEKFARGFERYMMEGTAPSKGLAWVFAQFKQWLTKIYQTVDRLKAPINDDIRGVMDRMLSSNPEKTVIAPDIEPGKMLADIHEGEFKLTPPEFARDTREAVEQETDLTAKQHQPEIKDDLTATKGTGNIQGQNAGVGETRGEPKDAGSSNIGQAPDEVASGGNQAGGDGNTARKEEDPIYTKPPPVKAFNKSESKKADATTSPIIKWIIERGGARKGTNLYSALRNLDYKAGQKGTPPRLFKVQGKYQGKVGAGELDNIPVSEFNDRFDTHLIGDMHGYVTADELENEIRSQSFDKRTLDEKEAHKEDNNEARFTYIKNDVFDVAAEMGIHGLRVSEVEKIATAAGERGDIKAEIFNHLSDTGRLTDILSQEKALHEANAMANAYEEEMADAQHGHQFEDDQQLTLEELENDRKQGIAATRPQTGAEGNERPGPAPEGAGGVQEGVQSGIGGTESAGRSGGAGSAGAAKPESGTERPTSPSSILEPAESELIDKAGNIRLDNLNTPEDVNEVLRQTAERNDNFMGARRGVISDAQALDLAESLGMDPKSLNLRKIGEAFNSEQILAARKLLIQSAMSVRDLMTKAADGTDEDILAYAEGKERHKMIQEQVSGITAEAGRALRAFRKLEGAEEAKSISQFIADQTGKTLFQLREEAKLGSSLDTPQKVSKFIQDSKKVSFGNKILEYWVNGLISGPATHTTYMVGNILLGFWKAIPETAAASLIGKAHDLMGKESGGVRLGETVAQFGAAIRELPAAFKAGGKALKSGVTTLLPGEGDYAKFPLFQQGEGQVDPLRMGNEHITWTQVGSDVYGAMQGLRDGFLATGELIKSGTAPWFDRKASPLGAIPDYAIKGVPIPVGSTVRIPARAIAGIHSFFRTTNYSMDKAAIAYRTAANEGLTGNAFAARIGDIITNPTQEVMDKATSTATDLTLMGRGGEFTNSLSRLTNASVNLPVLGETRLLKFVDPFVHISSNVINEAVLKRSPVGLLSSEIRADLMGRNGAEARDFAQARMLVGTALGITAGGLAAEGLISGSGPSDPKANAAWRILGGNQPHSVRIGDVWYDIHRLGPLGMLMGIAADMHDVAHSMANDDALKVASLMVHSVTQNILDESFMRGPAELIRALSDSDRYGASYVRNLVSSFVPISVGMSQWARAVDPYSREARTVMDAIKAKIPYLSETLHPRRDVWGEPIANKDVLGPAGFSAIYETKVNRDPTNQTLMRLGIYPSQPARKIRGVQLTDQQYDDFTRVAGKMSKMRLDNVISQQGFSQMPASSQIEFIKKTIESSREQARKLIMMQNPDIIRQALANKRLALKK